MWHYSVDGETFTNKITAYNKSKNIKFNSPKIYEGVDFSIEPESTFQNLLKQQAQKIRDTNDVVRLYYSGGSDSLLMLETFLTNDIHVDEIVCLKSGIPQADFEIDQYAIPFLKNKTLSKTKVTINTPTMEDYENHYGTSAIDIKFYPWNTYFRLHQTLELFNEENMRPGVANVKGFDKPKIMKCGNEWYTYFLDVDMEPLPHVINFFSDNPAVHSKQAHMFLREFRNHSKIKESEVWNYQNIWNKSTGRTNDTPLKTVFFEQGNNFVMQNSVKYYYINHKEKIALECMTKSNPSLLPLWYDKLSNLKSFVNGVEFWNNNHPVFGAVGHFSKFYCLTKNETKTVDELFPDGFKNQ